MKKEKQKEKREKSTFWKDFKAFISRGNIIDLAVAVVVGAAFTAIVNSLVNDIIKPFITWIVGGDTLSDLYVWLREPVLDPATSEVVIEGIKLNYGNLIMAILTFLIDAFVIFTIVRVIRNAQKRLKESGDMLKVKLIGKEGTPSAEAQPAEEEQPSAEQAPAPEPPKPTAEELLAEIRDLLKENKALSEKLEADKNSEK